MLSSLSSAFSQMELPDDFTAPPNTSNEDAAKQHDLRTAMTELLVSSILSSTATRRHETAKANIDALVKQRNNGETVILDGTESILYSDKEYSFSKKRIKGSKDVKVKDLLIELAKSGVSGDVIHASVSAAEKPRPGNLYYFIEKVGE